MAKKRESMTKRKKRRNKRRARQEEAATEHQERARVAQRGNDAKHKDAFRTDVGRRMDVRCDAQTQP